LIPKVISYTTMSIDGRIGVRGSALRLSSDKDLLRLHYYRSISDAVMVGANTVINDNPQLTVRLPDYKGRQPWRIIVDGRLRTPPLSRVYDTRTAPAILVTSEEMAGAIRKYVERGVRIIYTRRLDGELDLRSALEKAYENHGIKRVLVEGGGYLLASLLKQKLISEMIVSIAPVIIGKDAIPLINDSLDIPIHLKPIRIHYDADTGETIIHYKPMYKGETL
jgi:2,5-diamino-6-(ribosylamino)-4(3H)-pyrimidinone 5'-phosphate reductase